MGHRNYSTIEFACHQLAQYTCSTMASSKSLKKKSWGFDVRELDPSIRPQDDFFGYVNQRWIAKNPIPKSESRWGTFIKLRYDTDKKLYVLLQELMQKRTANGSDEQLVGDFFRAGMDTARRNSLGMKPLMPILKYVDSLSSITELPKLLAYLHSIGIGALFGSDVGQDSKNTDRYAFHLGQAGLGMPDRDYYLKHDPESVRARNAYREHVLKIFRLMGHSPVVAAQARDTVLLLETRIAQASMKKEDMRDPDKTYHKLTLPALRRLVPYFDWDTYLARTGVRALPYAIVMQPGFFTAMNGLLRDVPLTDWKTYIAWHVVNDYAGALSMKFVRQNFSFYGTTLSGTRRMKPLWRRVLATVNGGLGELIGKAYVARHFSKESKRVMNRMVDDLFEAYDARLRSLSWMTPATKRKALLKLRALRRKIGYPKRWKSYKGLVIMKDDYVGNILRMNEYEHRRAVRRLRQPIDREEWFMYPQTVNAYFAPNMNDIVFPAAILQPPFFDLSADDGVNYGSIGAVIGHEITHGFDDEGSRYDAKGNLKSWWTKDDRKRFDAKAKKVEKQFSRYTVADGVKVNGKLTLGENIADLGGLSIAYDAYQRRLSRTKRINLDGLSPEQRFFISFAIFEREHSRPEFVKTRVLTDPHSPGIFRINGPVSNFTPFYDAFGVKNGDTHFRPLSEREMVW